MEFRFVNSFLKLVLRFLYALMRAARCRLFLSRSPLSAERERSGTKLPVGSASASRLAVSFMRAPRASLSAPTACRKRGEGSTFQPPKVIPSPLLNSPYLANAITSRVRCASASLLIGVCGSFRLEDCFCWIASSGFEAGYFICAKLLFCEPYVVSGIVSLISMGVRFSSNWIELDLIGSN